MNKSDIRRFQEEAGSAYDRVPQSEAASWSQAAMLAEIALQLAKHNELLAEQNELLANIGGMLNVMPRR